MKRAKRRRYTLAREIERTWRRVWVQTRQAPADTVIYFHGVPVPLIRMG
jgi:hypothetical protein